VQPASSTLDVLDNHVKLNLCLSSISSYENKVFAISEK
jgi:hypothetical protein